MRYLPYNKEQYQALVERLSGYAVDNTRWVQTKHVGTTIRAIGGGRIEVSDPSFGVSTTWPAAVLTDRRLTTKSFTEDYGPKVERAQMRQAAEEAVALAFQRLATPEPSAPAA